MLDHLRLEHPEAELGGSQVQTVRKIVVARSYRFEWVNVSGRRLIGRFLRS